MWISDDRPPFESTLKFFPQILIVSLSSENSAQFLTVPLKEVLDEHEAVVAKRFECPGQCRQEAPITIARDPFETDGTFYISFDASEDALYLSKNGYWRAASADGDWAFPGLVRSSWAADWVRPHLGGTASQTPVVSGEAYLDNFYVSEGAIVDLPTAPHTLTVESTQQRRPDLGQSPLSHHLRD